MTDNSMNCYMEWCIAFVHFFTSNLLTLFCICLFLSQFIKSFGAYDSVMECLGKIVVFVNLLAFFMICTMCIVTVICLIAIHKASSFHIIVSFLAKRLNCLSYNLSLSVIALKSTRFSCVERLAGFSWSK